MQLGKPLKKVTFYVKGGGLLAYWPKRGYCLVQNTIFSSCWSILGPVGPYLTLFGAETPFLVPLVEFVLKSTFRKKNCCIVF